MHCGKTNRSSVINNIPVISKSCTDNISCFPLFLSVITQVNNDRWKISEPYQKYQLSVQGESCRRSRMWENYFHCALLVATIIEKIVGMLGLFWSLFSSQLALILNHVFHTIICMLLEPFFNPYPSLTPTKQCWEVQQGSWQHDSCQYLREERGPNSITAIKRPNTFFIYCSLLQNISLSFAVWILFKYETCMTVFRKGFFFCFI